MKRKRGKRHHYSVYVVELSPEVLQRVTLLRRTLVGMNPVQAMEMLVKKLGEYPSNAAFPPFE